MLDSRDIPDHMTEDGARKLASRIEEYWRKKGYTEDGDSVRTWLELIPQRRSSYHGPAWAVRSNMVGGLPPGAVGDGERGTPRRQARQGRAGYGKTED